jgi:hypothetical protein
MDYNEFADKIKAKYPDYADVPNRELAEKMVAKYPDYKETVTFDAAPSMVDKGIDVLKQAAGMVGPALERQIPQLKEAATLGLSSAPQIGERATNFLQGKPNAPAQTLLQAAANRPDVTASVAASMIPGVGLGVSAARVAGAVGANALDPQSSMLGNAATGALSAGLEALPYGAGKLASLFNLGKGTVAAERAAGVLAAKNWKVPLTRGEQTGSIFDASVESTLGKTMTGGEVFAKAKSEADEAFQIGKDLFKSNYGTSLPPSEIGASVKSGIDSTVQGLKSQAQAIYESMPVTAVKPANMRDAASTLLREQLDLPRVDRDGALMRRLLEYRKLGTKMEKSIQQVTDKAGNVSAITKFQRVENPAAYPKSSALQRISSDLKDAWRKSVKTGESMGTVGGRDATILGKAIQQDIQQVGELRQQLDAANKLYSKAKALDKNSLVKRLRTAGPDEATGLIFDGKKMSKILVAKAALGPKFNATKAAYVTQLIDDPKLSVKLAGMTNEYKANVFAPDELKALTEAAEIQKVRGAADKLQGTSGSARTNAILNQLKDIKLGLTTALIGAATLNPVVAATGVGAAVGGYYGPRMAANAWMKRGMNATNIGALVPKSLPKTRVGVNAIRQYLMGQQQAAGQ